MLKVKDNVDLRELEKYGIYPTPIWQNNDYPDEYTFRDVDIVNVFQLLQENQQLKEEIDKVIEYLQSKEFEENFPYKANEYQVRGDILNIIDKAYFNRLLDMLKGENNE